MGHAERIIHIDFQKKRVKPTARKTGEGLLRAPLLADVQNLRISFETAQTEEQIRSRLILEFLCRFGMRASELILLKKSDFVQIQGQNALRFYRPKRNDFHTVLMSDRSKNFLLSLIEQYHTQAQITDDHIFWSLLDRIKGKRTKITTRSIQRIVNSFGITDGRGKQIAPHSLRHYVGVKASTDKDHSVGSKILGNSIKVFTEYYSRPWEDSLE